MTWWQFSLDCQASELDAAEALLLELGALSISIADAGDEPIYEPLPGTTPLWSKSVLTATFAAESDCEALYHQLHSRLPRHLATSLRRHELQDQDWVQASRQHFQPVRCGPGLWIVPSWADPPDPAATIVRLDPGLAFGTGSHPTTAMCLEWLAAHDISGLEVIDYGCGSGILAIAASKLGASRVVAVDIDTQALDACRANLRGNEIDPRRVDICLPEALHRQAADLLIANILSAPLVELAEAFAGLVKSGGRILLSGILKSQLEDIQLAYQPYFELDAAALRDSWACIGGRRY